MSCTYGGVAVRGCLAEACLFLDAMHMYRGLAEVGLMSVDHSAHTTDATLNRGRGAPSPHLCPTCPTCPTGPTSATGPGRHERMRARTHMHAYLHLYAWRTHMHARTYMHAHTYMHHAYRARASQTMSRSGSSVFYKSNCTTIGWWLWWPYGSLPSLYRRSAPSSSSPFIPQQQS